MLLSSFHYMDVSSRLRHDMIVASPRRVVCSSQTFPSMNNTMSAAEILRDLFKMLEANVMVPNAFVGLQLGLVH